MNLIRTLAFASVLLTLTAGVHAQNEPERPRSRPGAGQEAPGGRPGGRQADPARVADRMMRADTDKDGRLSREELSGGRFIAVFDQADANGDGFLEAKEVTLFIQNRAPRGGRPGMEGRPGTPAATPPKASGPSEQAFVDAMDRAGKALRGLRRTAFDADTFDRDLKALLDLESSLIDARRNIAAVPMSDAAREKFGSDRTAYQRAFQIHMVTSLMETLEIEMAILKGDPEKAKQGVAKLLESRNKSHDLFEQH